jgi:hypothetical protein
VWPNRLDSPFGCFQTARNRLESISNKRTTKLTKYYPRRQEYLNVVKKIISSWEIGERLFICMINRPGLWGRINRFSLRVEEAAETVLIFFCHEKHKKPQKRDLYSAFLRIDVFEFSRSS